jgi:hypothetical protein
MARYSTGQPVRLSTTVRDVTGTLVSPTAITLTISKPDGTTQSYSSPASDGTGLLHQDIPVTDLGQVGHYQYKWTSTGTGAGESAGNFDVFDPFEPAVLSLQDAKDMLNIPQSSTASDAELQSYVATIETSLEGLTGGPLISRVITGERCEFTGWYQMLQVRQRPLVSVTSITSVMSGTVLDISAGLDINGAARTIRKKDGSPFPSDSAVVLVTYVAGWGTAAPAALNLAARLILDHLWETQHGPAGRPSMGGAELLTAVPGFPYAIPNGAAELLKGTVNGLPFMDQVLGW